MNWISNYVRPKINSLFSRRELPENLWTKCPECGTMLFHRELADNLNVCTACDHHMALMPRARFATLFDAGAFVEVPVPEPTADPLHFRDSKRYTDRMRAAQRATGEREAMLVAEGEMGRTPIVAAAQDFSFMGGSMGMYVGNAIIAAAERAIALGRPLILFSAAGGARMQEGILSLMQMPRTTVAVEMLREAGLPYIVVLTHPTTGGVTASYAMLGDVHIAEPNALICFAGPRVIEQTIREKLPEGFQRAEYLLEHGMLDRVIHRRHLREELITVTRLLMRLPPAVKGELPPPSDIASAMAQGAEAGAPAASHSHGGGGDADAADAATPGDAAAPPGAPAPAGAPDAAPPGQGGAPMPDPRKTDPRMTEARKADAPGTAAPDQTRHDGTEPAEPAPRHESEARE